MVKPMNFIIQFIVQMGGWSMLAAAGLVTYDVITRKIFNVSIAGADEISGYVFAISTACAYSYALLTRANIRIDFIYNKFPPTLQRWMDILSITLTAGFFGVVCYFAYNLVDDAFLYGSRAVTPLQTPLAIPQTLWFIALCFALLTAVTLLVLSLKALLSGDKDKVKSLVGIPSLDEEIKAELGELTDVSPKNMSTEEKA